MLRHACGFGLATGGFGTCRSRGAIRHPVLADLAEEAVFNGGRTCSFIPTPIVSFRAVESVTMVRRGPQPVASRPERARMKWFRSQCSRARPLVLKCCIGLHSSQAVR
jgi:hypothetical protein